MKKAFTLLELLAVIVILGILVVLAVPKVTDIIETAKMKTYKSNEEVVIKSAKNYLTFNEKLLPKEIGETTEITFEQLQNEKYMNQITDSEGVCDGYILVTKTEEDYEYIPHVKCGEKNTISSSTEDGLIAHYTFDDFQEPTENLLRNVIDLNFENDSLPNIYNYGGSTIELSDDENFNNHKVYKINFNESSASGPYFTSDIYVGESQYINISFWIYVPTEVVLDSSFEVHRHALPDGECLDGNCHHYESINTSNSIWDNSVERNKWIRKDVTIKTHSDDNVINGYKIRLFCFAKGANPSSAYFYMTEPQIENKDHSTPFTSATREGEIINYTTNNNNSALYKETSPEWMNYGKNGFYSFKENSYFLSEESINLMSSQSICLWMKPNANGWLEGLATLHNHATTSNIGLNYSEGYLTASIGYIDGSREYSSKKSNIKTELNKWNHSCLIYNNDTKKIVFFIKGNFHGEYNITKTIKFTTNKILIGEWSTSYLNHYHFNGSIDDIKIYNRALSEEEIKYDYYMNKYKYE